MENYGDDKAEVFYKNNYENSKSKNEQSDKNNSESLSSLDNITDNKIIFTKKTKKIIDKNLDSNCGTITLTATSININTLMKYNACDEALYNGSFQNIIKLALYFDAPISLFMKEIMIL